MKIKDIAFSEQFWRDWENVPARIQECFNKDLEIVSVTRELMPSANAHKIKMHPEGWWIGYVNVGRNSWRFLFSISSSGVMVIERIMNHNSMDLYLKI